MVNTDQQCMSSFLFYNHPTLHLSQFSSLSPNNQQEHCLPNVTQHHYNHPNEYQWVKFPADKSNQQFQQVHTSPQKLYHSFLPYQQFCTPEKLSSPLNEKLYGNGSTDETPLQSACQCNPSLENTHLPYIPGITDQLGAEETYYEVRRRNSPPSRDAQASAEGRVMSGDTVSPQNLVLQVRPGGNLVSDRHACYNVRFEAFAVMKIQVKVFRVVALCIVKVGSIVSEELAASIFRVK